MELHRYENPAAVEELVFRVKPEKVEEFLQIDHDIWTLALASKPGFLSKEVWVSEVNPGEITQIIYWESMEQWKAISAEWLAEVQKEFDAKIGLDNYEFVAAPHETNQKYRITEYK